MATRHIYTDCDFNNNELKRFRVENLPADPEPADGGIYYNTEAQEFRKCVSGVWVPMSEGDGFTSGGSTEANVQSDWLENDYLSNTYIKNRTHYISGLVISSAGSSSVGSYAIDGVVRLWFYGKMYEVTKGGQVTLNSGPPVTASLNEGYILTISDVSSYIATYPIVVVTKVVKLNDIFIPDTIARKEDIPAASSAEWYNIHTISSGSDGQITPTSIIENFNDVLRDTSKYRMVLMRFRNVDGGASKSWRIPMFSGTWDKDTGELKGEESSSRIPWSMTWWPITGRETIWWEDRLYIEDVLNLATKYKVKTSHYVFKNSNSTRMLVGCAVFKRMEDGLWQRISNIGKVMLRLDRSLNVACQTLE